MGPNNEALIKGAVAEAFAPRSHVHLLHGHAIVAPGPILTETVTRDFPIVVRKFVEDEATRGCAAAPEDTAEALAFLASVPSRNITRQALAADCGVFTYASGSTAYLNAFGE